MRLISPTAALAARASATPATAAAAAMRALRARTLASSAQAAARRREGDAGARGTDFANIQTLTGDLETDGLHRYEVEFFETAEWVKTAIRKMQTAEKDLAALHKPFVAPTSAQPVVVKYTDRYTYDFTKPPPVNNAVTLQVRVANLGLSAEQRHKFLLLAGSTYDPYLDVVTLHDAKEPQDSISAEIDRTLSLKELSARLDRILAEAKDTKDSFTDVPVDLSYLPPKRPKQLRNLEFPKQWLQPKPPASAPVAPEPAAAPAAEQQPHAGN
ncbi:28S ribosomal protein S35, mitochondrial [Polyrhizophydium stewartii]|uniref:28S ribosomal protein S35, mitochondrial n=1 Tax=Polyrhizophydium stewartii TaxID=2732419 RepID=A0ABR4MYY9_9FUNG|nr:37S ribosomal protein S24, mitochondrial [Polyrhizophydium stewartii]